MTIYLPDVLAIRKIESFGPGIQPRQQAQAFEELLRHTELHDEGYRTAVFMQLPPSAVLAMKWDLTFFESTDEWEFRGLGESSLMTARSYGQTWKSLLITDFESLEPLTSMFERSPTVKRLDRIYHRQDGIMYDEAGTRDLVAIFRLKSSLKRAGRRAR